MTKEQMDAIWNAPGVQNAGHLNIWYFAGRDWRAKPGRERKPAWDKALLKHAKRELPNWYAKRNDPWWLT
jgi:hypothetical protein